MSDHAREKELPPSVRVDEIRQKLRHRAYLLNATWKRLDPTLAADCVGVMRDADALLAQVQEQEQRLQEQKIKAAGMREKLLSDLELTQHHLDTANQRVQEQQQAHDAHVTAACQLATGVIAAELREARAQLEEQQQEIARYAAMFAELGRTLKTDGMNDPAFLTGAVQACVEIADKRGSQLTVLQFSLKELVSRWETRPTTFESSEARQAREECASQLSTLIDQAESP